MLLKMSVRQDWYACAEFDPVQQTEPQSLRLATVLPSAGIDLPNANLCDVFR